MCECTFYCNRDSGFLFFFFLFDNLKIYIYRYKSKFFAKHDIFMYYLIDYFFSNKIQTPFFDRLKMTKMCLFLLIKNRVEKILSEFIDLNTIETRNKF